MSNIFDSLKYKLIVSCQAEGDEPFNSPEALLMFAKAAISGGAAGIRSQGFENVRHIREQITVPVIGLIKSTFDDGFVRITGSFNEVETLVKTNCHIIAVDGTFRQRERMRGPEFIAELKKRFDCLIMADISTYSEGVACADYGADCISSTLSGYTPDTFFLPKDEPDYNIIAKLSKSVSIPVFAEGKIYQPKFARFMLEYGAWAVVVGSAITRPHLITSWFNDEMKKAHITDARE